MGRNLPIGSYKTEKDPNRQDFNVSKVKVWEATESVNTLQHASYTYSKYPDMQLPVYNKKCFPRSFEWSKPWHDPQKLFIKLINTNFEKVKREGFYFIYRKSKCLKYN